MLKMKEPQGLPAQKATLLRMETSSFCQMIGERNSKVYVPARPNPGRVVVPYVPNRLVLLPGAAAQPVVPARQALPPRQRHTAEELDAMRSKNICFKCKGKYFRGHVCPLKELQILTVVDGFELMVLDEEGA